MVIYFLKMSLTRDITYTKTESLAQNTTYKVTQHSLKGKKIFKRKRILQFELCQSLSSHFCEITFHDRKYTISLRYTQWICSRMVQATFCLSNLRQLTRSKAVSCWFSISSTRRRQSHLAHDALFPLFHYRTKSKLSRHYHPFQLALGYVTRP